MAGEDEEGARDAYRQLLEAPALEEANRRARQDEREAEYARYPPPVDHGPVPRGEDGRRDFIDGFVECLTCVKRHGVDTAQAALRTLREAEAMIHGG